MLILIDFRRNHDLDKDIFLPENFHELDTISHNDQKCRSRSESVHIFLLNLDHHVFYYP